MSTLDDELQNAVKKVQSGEKYTITVRDLLHLFGASRRGVWICSAIRSALEKYELASVPDFEFAFIDSRVSLKRMKDIERVQYEMAVDPTIRIGHLKDANKDLVTVSPDHTIEHAVTVMLEGDFSQLPVMTTPTEVKGAISWRSVAQAKVIAGSPTRVRQCMEQPTILSFDRSLLDVVQEVLNSDYVLIRGQDKQITGIITMSDLGLQFHQLGEPFILLGEIENHLRLLLSGKFKREELKATIQKVPEAERDIDGLEDLTFGQYQRLLDNDQRWKRVGIGLDRKQFVERLNRVREIRNDIMHFNPDPPAEADISQVRRMAQMLRTVRRIQRNK